MIVERNLENEMHQWDLFKSYGQFNIYFEATISRYRQLLIELVRRYYGFDVDWEDEDEEPVTDNLQDRILKIILHDDGAGAIVEKCRSCFMDISSAKVKAMLKMNDVEPLTISERDIDFAKEVFKQGLELVKLRNIIIHSHYEGAGFLPLSSLKGKKDAKTAKGYEERIYQFDILFFDQVNAQLQDLEYFVHSIYSLVTLSYGTDNFSLEDFKRIKNMSFSTTVNKD